MFWWYSEAMNLSTETMDERVRKGKELEVLVIKNLSRQLSYIGCKILDATDSEDKYDKIDRWIITAKGTKLSLQLKVRQTGDDMIYEMVKNLETGEEGRDLKCRADLYLYVDRNGKGWMYKVPTIKTAAKTLLEQVTKDLAANPAQTEWNAPTYEVKVTTDNFHGNTKLMAYFSPTHFPIVSSFPNLYA